MATLNKKILIVDDEPDIREILQFFLEDAGHVVVACEDGESALATFKKDHFDLIITDLTMPGMSGKDLVLNLYELPDFKAKVVISSGSSEGIEGVRYDGMLSKPFTPNKIQDLIVSIF